MLCIQNNTKVQSKPGSCKNAQSSKEILVPLYVWMPPLLGVPPLPPLPRPKENIKHQQHGGYLELLGDTTVLRLTIVENQLVCHKCDEAKAISPKNNILTALLMPLLHMEVGCPETWGLELLFPNPNSQNTQEAHPSCNPATSPAHQKNLAPAPVKLNWKNSGKFTE